MNVAVIGGFECSKKMYQTAYTVGKLIAQNGWVLICGGGSGVMEAAAKGARDHGGTTIGILPGASHKEANPYIDIGLPTGMGYARNILIVRAAHVLIAINGKYGTLSEIAFALNEEKRVIGIATWDIEGVETVHTPQEAINAVRMRGRKH